MASTFTRENIELFWQAFQDLKERSKQPVRKQLQFRDKVNTDINYNLFFFNKQLTAIEKIN